MSPVKSLLPSWHVVSQVAIAICGIVTSFVASPPALALRDGGGSALVNFTNFLVSCILLVIITTFALQKRSSKLASKRWLTVGVAACLFGAFTFGIYRYYLQIWTCNVSDVQLIVGEHYSPAAEAYSLLHSSNCEDLLAAFASDPLRVWEGADLYMRKLLFDWLFILIICLFSLALISLIQARKLSIKPA